MPKPVLGILTLYLNDRKLIEDLPVYRRMTLSGRRLGLQAAVFTPEDVDDAEEKVTALIYDPGLKRWVRRRIPLPHIIYDRARFQRTKRWEQLKAFRRKYPNLLYLSRPLRNKWVLYQAFLESAEFRRHLPSTRLYESPEDVYRMLKRFPTVYFKPINGTGGRGILRIDRLPQGRLLLQGRNHSRRIVPAQRIRGETLPSFLRAWDRNNDKYIVQQGLDIKLPDGRIHDYRMLVQKNGRGKWEVTGCAGRVGPKLSITSNLHGGGNAAGMAALLERRGHGPERTARIRETAETLGVGIARFLEQKYGALCELALDLAVDKRGGVWLLEVNPKPSREVFLRAGEKEAYRRAVTRPMEYAFWCYRQHQEPSSQIKSIETEIDSEAPNE